MEKGRVAEVNKRFYDLVAEGYEKADGRRKRNEWLEKILKTLSIGHDTFLDVGAGTGYVSYIASEYFRNIISVDVSQEMLDRRPLKVSRIVTKCESADKMSIGSNSVDVACTFAMLHHIESITPVFREIHRVLKPHGVYYSDHDIESHFVKRHQLPLRIYRAIVNKKKVFAKINPEAGKLYDIVEHHKDGLNADLLRITLTAIGFKVYIFYHWEGILPIKGDSFKQGYAPMMRIIAIKQ